MRNASGRAAHQLSSDCTSAGGRPRPGRGADRGRGGRVATSDVVGQGDQPAAVVVDVVAVDGAAAAMVVRSLPTFRPYPHTEVQQSGRAGTANRVGRYGSSAACGV